MAEKFVAAGLSPSKDVVGLTGLVPFAVIDAPAVQVRPGGGLIRILVEFPADRRLAPGRAVQYRIHGGEVGVDVARNGQIVSLRDEAFPLVIAYKPRVFPDPPARGELGIELSFWWTDGGTPQGQDVLWRIPVAWDVRGGDRIEVQFRFES